MKTEKTKAALEKVLSQYRTFRLSVWAVLAMLAAALAWCGKNHIFKAGGHVLDKQTYQVWRAVILFLILLVQVLLY